MKYIINDILKLCYNYSQKRIFAIGSNKALGPCRFYHTKYFFPYLQVCLNAYVRLSMVKECQAG